MTSAVITPMPIRARVLRTGAIADVLGSWLSPHTGVPMYSVAVNGFCKHVYGDEVEVIGGAR